MRFDDWIIKTGPKQVAKQLRVDPSTVSLWRRGRAFPRPKKLLQIRQLSGGKVTFETMIQHFINCGK